MSRRAGYGPTQYGEVASLQRNGYVRVREPRFGTPVDVSHDDVTKGD
jgi:hypothetical protein